MNSVLFICEDMQDASPGDTAATGDYKKFKKIAMRIVKRRESELRLQKPPQSYQTPFQRNRHTMDG